MSKIDNALDNLIKALDNDKTIKEIIKVKQLLPISLVEKLKNNNLSIEERKEIIFNNEELIQYNQLLNELNLTIMGINQKLKLFNKYCGNCK